MSDDGEYVERTRTTDTPRSRETVREIAPGPARSGATGWWLAAIVAILAAIGLYFVFASQNRQDQLQAAREQGAAQARLDAATADAQRAASQASQAAQSAVSSAAHTGRRAAETAQNAGQAAQDTSSTEPATQQSSQEQSPPQ